MAAGLTPEQLKQAMGYPIQQPPPGIKSNFVDPESIAYQVYITAGVCLPLMLVFALTRFISKFALGNQILIGEEVIFALGLVLCLGCIGINIAWLPGGAFGKDAWNVLLGALTRTQLILALLGETVLPIAICSVKVSVLLLYRHVFFIHRWMRVTCTVSIVLLMVWHVSLTVAIAAMCSPKLGHYSQLDYLSAFISESCNNTRVLVVLQGVGNVTTDVFLFVLPLPAVWKLNMRVRQKVAVSCMFGVGLCACAASSVGLYFRFVYYTAGSNNTRLTVPVAATSMAEEAAGILICCMPATAFLFKTAKGATRRCFSSMASRVTRLVQPLHSPCCHLFKTSSAQLRNGSQGSDGQDKNGFDSKPSGGHHIWNAADSKDLRLLEMNLTRSGIAMPSHMIASDESEKH